MEKNLRSLLSSNRFNKPAMDYLMALLLLEKDVEEIEALLPDYLELDNGRIPSLLDECHMVYKITHQENSKSSIGVTQNTVDRFEEYATVLRQSSDQNQAAHILYPKYKNSFWFYLNFSQPPN